MLRKVKVRVQITLAGETLVNGKKNGHAHGLINAVHAPQRARGVISIHSSQDIARCADAIERGEHEE